MKNETRDERLREILRAADPADGETGLTAEEVRAMRRTVLTAAPEPRWRFLPFPLLAGAALAAALAAIVVLMMWPRTQTTMPPQGMSKVAVAPRPGMNARATESVPSGTTGISETSTSVVPPGTIDASPAASAPGERRPNGKAARRPRQTFAREPDRLAAVEEEPRTRQVQFATPGGTRVIWILTTDKAL